MFGFRRWLSNFMYGRYGIDRLEKTMMIVYLIIAVATVFVRNIPARAVICIVQWIFLILIIFRMFSKNCYARKRENDVYEKITRKLKRKALNLKMRIQDLRYKRYRTCPNCGAVARLPIKRGRHTVKCPACQKSFKVFIAF